MFRFVNNVFTAEFAMIPSTFWFGGNLHALKTNNGLDLGTDRGPGLTHTCTTGWRRERAGAGCPGGRPYQDDGRPAGIGTLQNHAERSGAVWRQTSGYGTQSKGCGLD